MFLAWPGIVVTTLASIEPAKIALFQRTVWDYYRANKRIMPWRTEPTPYYVLVSEMMLQQTHVPRVRQKFASFIRHFPTLQSLAATKLSDVLKAWSGLGYNRRAKFLWQAANMVVNDYAGVLPANQKDLIRLPGIGPNTAGAILAYVYNQPVVFIETNIRSVYIHHFFDDSNEAVSDDDLRVVIAATIPQESPRDWYWALMNYGTHLKATIGSNLQRVKNYKPQSRFEGSRRQIRGQVLRQLAAAPGLSQLELAALITDERCDEACQALLAEGLITLRAGRLYLTDA